MFITYIILGAVALIVIWLIAAYNGLVRLKTQAVEALSDIDVQTKRRFDLIPNLVETVKGYAAHEKTALEDVTKARTQFMSAKTPKDQAAADNYLTYKYVLGVELPLGEGTSESGPLNLRPPVSGI